MLGAEVGGDHALGVHDPLGRVVCDDEDPWHALRLASAPFARVKVLGTAADAAMLARKRSGRGVGQVAADHGDDQAAIQPVAALVGVEIDPRDERGA
jgi:hypothetical protein